MVLMRTKLRSYDERKVQELLANPEIVRNRLKVQAAIQNAQAFLQVQSDFASFDAFIWQFVNGRPQQYARQSLQEVPASTRESDAMSKELKRRGFTFVGTTICYAFMQAVGMVNDHIVDCFRWQEVQALAASPGVTLSAAKGLSRSAERSAGCHPCCFPGCHPERSEGSVSIGRAFR